MPVTLFPLKVKPYLGPLNGWGEGILIGSMIGLMSAGSVTAVIVVGATGLTATAVRVGTNGFVETVVKVELLMM
jgi:hypothetical protein